MKILLAVFISLIPHYSFATENFPSGIWEGYENIGATYREFILEIGENGSGYYGFSPDIKNDYSICFRISQETLLNKGGFYQQENNFNTLKFTVLIAPSIDNVHEAISILQHPMKNESVSQSWSLIPIENNARNSRIVRRCKEFLKEHP